MKIVRLKGGLGNQMFQYSFAKLLSLYTDEDIKLDCSLYENGEAGCMIPLMRFYVKFPLATDEEIQSMLFFKRSKFKTVAYKIQVILESILNKKYFFQDDRTYVAVDKIINNNYFDGYWQNIKYVNEISSHILKDFLPENVLSEQTQNTICEISRQNSVFVGIRRGDYIKEKRLYGEFDYNYYLKAIQYIDNILPSPVYYIFSNDIEWCKENIDFGNRNIVFREKLNIVSDFDEFLLMSSCENAIISNSTFHWWAAYLIKNSEKIVCCPKKWFYNGSIIDIYPSEWIKL